MIELIGASDSIARRSYRQLLVVPLSLTRLPGSLIDQIVLKAWFQLEEQEQLLLIVFVVANQPGLLVAEWKQATEATAVLALLSMVAGIGLSHD